MMSDQERNGLDDRPVSRQGDPLGSNSEIGRKLKQYYDDLVSDEVPDRFAQLLSQLASAEDTNGKG